MNKLSLIRTKMKERDIDAVIVNDELNQRYLSSFDFTDGFIIVTMENAYLVTDFRYYEMALNTVSDEFAVVTPKNRAEYIDEVLKKDCVRRLGLEGDTLSYSEYEGFKKAHPDYELINIEDMIAEIRKVKSSDEIEKIQKSQDITDAAFRHVVKMINYNMTEIDVAAELEYAMKKLGSEGPAFGTIAVSGDASALPHGTPRNIKLKRGFLTMDFGSKYAGYCSDMTRTVVIGSADDEMKKLYNTVLAAQKAALDYLKFGRDAFLADKSARDIIDVDYKGAFGHSLGHSVGLLVHERPALSPMSKGVILKPGNIVTVEPGIYLFGKYGCRIEDMVAICENGIHNFTNSPKELIEI